MDIRQARRVLLLGAREAGALSIVKDLTGSAPHPDVNGSTAGLTHEWNIETPYYSAKVPIWVDEVSDVKSWTADFLKDEAKEVVDAVGAWIFCFEKQQDGSISEEVEEAMKGIQEVVDEHTGLGSDVVLLAVAIPTKKQAKAGEGKQQSHEEQDDKCMQYNFEFIDYAATGKNEFGEKVGFERLKEALEANDWDAGGDDDDDELNLEDLDFDADDDVSGFGREEAEITAELFGMKAALGAEEGEDDLDSAAEDLNPPGRQAGQVDDLDRLMGRLLAIKEQSVDLPEVRRKRMAAQAVRDLMKGNGSGDR